MLKQAFLNQCSVKTQKMLICLLGLWDNAWLEDPREHSSIHKRIQEYEMATHSSVLVCKIPWTKEPGGPQSMELQTAGHNWTSTHTPNSWSNLSSFRKVHRGTRGDSPEEATLDVLLKERKEIIQMKWGKGMFGKEKHNICDVMAMGEGVGNDERGSWKIGRNIKKRAHPCFENPSNFKVNMLWFRGLGVDLKNN